MTGPAEAVAPSPSVLGHLAVPSGRPGSPKSLASLAQGEPRHLAPARKVARRAFGPRDRKRTTDSARIKDASPGQGAGLAPQADGSPFLDPSLPRRGGRSWRGRGTAIHDRSPLKAASGSGLSSHRRRTPAVTRDRAGVGSPLPFVHRPCFIVFMMA